MSVQQLQLDFAALNTCLQDLNHLLIDISRLTPETEYEEQIGGYGTVRVSTLDSGTPGALLVAAKTIRLKDRHKDPKRLAFRLARELKIWAGFRHPHVLPLLGYYLDTDYKIAVLISRYMIHGDLREYVDQQKPLWEARLHLVCDLTDGLAYLHEQTPPVLHGDIKMKNVLVNATRRGMLADFGLSKALEEGPTGLTTSDGLKGTLRCYSPELIRDQDGSHSLPSDIWAWGCLVLEALAEIIPYAEKKSEHSIIRALMNGEPPGDTEKLSLPVPNLKALLARCWTIQPSERPSAVDCLRAIESALSTPRLVVDATKLVKRALNILRNRPIPTFGNHLPRKQTSEVQPLSNGEYDVQDVEDILRESDVLWYHPSEMHDLVNLKDWADKWDQRAGAMIAKLHQAGPNAPLDRAAWEALFFEAYSHNYNLGRFEDVGRVVKRIRLLEELCTVEDAPLTMEDVEELQKQAANCSLPSDNEQAVKLKEFAERGAQWCKYAHMVLDEPVIALEDLNKLVAPPCSVPVFPSLLERIDSVRGRAREIEKQAKAILYPPIGHRTPISEALRLVSTTQKDFLIPAVQILAEVAPQAAHIEKTCFDIINNQYSSQISDKPLFAELRDVRSIVQKKLWIFMIPSFDIVDQQLVQHDAWLEKLPWYRTPEPAAQGKLIVDDVVQSTRPEDDKPPSDPECTCICPIPVKVTVEKPEDTVQCDHCGAKLHSKCIEGSCPFCDHHHWNGPLTKTRNFEYIDLLPIARAAPDLTRNYSLAWKHMDIIITYVDRLTRAIDMFLAGVYVNEQNINPAPPNFIPQIRHFLRKLYKMQFSIKARADIPSYGLTLCHVHRLLANYTKATQDASQKKKAQRRPKFIFTAEVMPLANDGSRCLCKADYAGRRLITCNSCSYNFHCYCVRYDEANNPAPKPWRCPMCMIRKGKQYPQSAVRVRTVAQQEEDVYVDTKACFENYSWQLIRQRLPPPTDYTIILELERFIPGSNQYPESSLAAEPPAPASQPQSSAGSSTPISREPSRAPKPAAPSAASTSGSASQPPAASGSSNSSSRAVMPSPAYIAPTAPKRKAPTSPAAENPRRRKLLFREGDTANGA